METTSQAIGSAAQSFLKGIAYSVEHMTITQWAILGTAAVIIGFMLLRTQRF